MLLANITISKTTAKVKEVFPVTAGLVGATVAVEFDSTWNGYSKVYVWSGCDRVITDTTASGVVPPEVVANQKSELKFGVYGIKDGEATPTIWANLGYVRPSATPTDDVSTDPSLPVWAQLKEQIDSLGAVDPEAVEKIITDYLAKNPPKVTESDPTVPAWAKQSQKPKYTAAEVGAQPVGNYLTRVPDGYATEEFVRSAIAEAAGSSATIGTVNLVAAKWVGSENLYSQVVSIDGVTENSQVDLTPSVEQLVVFYEKDLTFVTENEGGIVTVYAIGQKPTNDYTIQVTITEVTV